jgi:hypothetical protein
MIRSILCHAYLNLLFSVGNSYLYFSTRPEHLFVFADKVTSHHLKYTTSQQIPVMIISSTHTVTNVIFGMQQLHVSFSFLLVHNIKQGH